MLQRTWKVDVKTINMGAFKIINKKRIAVAFDIHYKDL